MTPPLHTIIPGLPFAEYLAHGDTSKSSLWTALKRSPAHARTEKEPSNAMDMGSAVHCAILEPDEFSRRFVRGPDDRRGNRWREAQEEYGDSLLTSGDYTAALAIRDAVRGYRNLRPFVHGEAQREVSVFSRHETGLIFRVRPDAIAQKHGLVCDIKTTTDARPFPFANRVKQFGYHAQEALYREGINAAGMDIAGFLFVVIETKPPYGIATYELEPSAVEEGAASMERALHLWAECKRANAWPGYSPDVQPLDISKYAYEYTNPEDE